MADVAETRSVCRARAGSVVFLEEPLSAQESAAGAAPQRVTFHGDIALWTVALMPEKTDSRQPLRALVDDARDGPLQRLQLAALLTHLGTKSASPAPAVVAQVQ